MISVIDTLKLKITDLKSGDWFILADNKNDIPYMLVDSVQGHQITNDPSLLLAVSLISGELVTIGVDKYVVKILEKKFKTSFL